MRLHYHPGKANVVADALSRKSYVNTLITGGFPKELVDDLREFCLEIVPRGYVATLAIKSTLLGKIREAQKTEKEIAEIKERLKDFVRMSMTLYGLRIVFMCLMTPISGSWFCKRPMIRRIQFTQEIVRCFWI